MPDSSILGLTEASYPLSGAEYAPIVQGGITLRALLSQLRPVTRVAGRTGDVVITASDLADFSAAVRTLRLDQMAAAAAAVSMGGNKITSLGTPTADSDAVTKVYVDSLLSGLDVKASCIVATLINLSVTMSGDVLTATSNGVMANIDGVTPAVGNRILVKAQSSAPQNGIFVVTSVGSAGTPFVLTRAADFDSSTNVSGGAFTFIEQGSTNAATGWILTNSGVISIGSTGLTFSQFSAATAYTAGTGLSLVANAFSVIFGTTAGTAAQGNDTRIVGAAPLNNPVFTGNAGALGALMLCKATRDLTTIVGSPATGTIAFDAISQARLYYTTNASANWTLNVRGDGSNTLDSVLPVGQSVSIEFWSPQGATPFWNNVLQVDGIGQTIKWLGATPTAGNASGIDVYGYTILKTAPNTYTVLGSQTKFA